MSTLPTRALLLSLIIATSNAAPSGNEDCSLWIDSLRKAGMKKTSRKQAPLDNVFSSVFMRVGTRRKVAVEFGFNYVKPNYPTTGLAMLERRSLVTYGLRKYQGWNVTYFDAVVGDPEAQVVKALLTEQNIVGHFKSARIPLRLDLMVIDIDGLEIWLLRSLLSGGYRPRVISIEFNPNFGHQLITCDRTWHPHKGAGFGASATVINMVASQYNYTTVFMPTGKYADQPHMDMILVRSNLLEACASGSIPSFEHFARDLPKRTFHTTCTKEESAWIVDYPLALRGDAAGARAAAQEALQTLNRQFPQSNPVCDL